MIRWRDDLPTTLAMPTALSPVLVPQLLVLQYVSHRMTPLPDFQALMTFVAWNITT